MLQQLGSIRIIKYNLIADMPYVKTCKMSKSPPTRTCKIKISKGLDILTLYQSKLKKERQNFSKC